MRALVQRSIRGVRRGIDLLSAAFARRRCRAAERPLAGGSSMTAAAAIRRNGNRALLEGTFDRTAAEFSRKPHWSGVKTQTRLTPFRRAA